MLKTYKAILRGNQLEWQESVAELTTLTKPIPVHVTILHEIVPETINTQGQEMAAALEKLAGLPQRTILDPLAWEREARRERELPNRN